MPVYQLDEQLWFPHPSLGEEEGFIAVGGDLSPDRLLLAYSHGFFPWFPFSGGVEPQWFCPLDRFVIFPDEIHISHSLRTQINSGRFACTFNRDFGSVIRGCSEVNGRNRHAGAWLGDDMIEAYMEMHRLGYAKSVEVWRLPDGQSEEMRLIGGLYGISLGKGFFGESMFSLESGASKLALVFLAEVCRAGGLALIDCQYETPHLHSMGGRHIPYKQYMELITPD